MISSQQDLFLIESVCFNQCIYQKCITKIYVIYHYVRQGLKQIMELGILKIACHKVSVDVNGEYSSARLGIAIRTRVSYSNPIESVWPGLGTQLHNEFTSDIHLKNIE